MRLKPTVNARTRRIAVVTWAMTPIVGHGGGGNRREPDRDDADAVGFLDPDLGQTPGLGGLRARMAGYAGWRRACLSVSNHESPRFTVRSGTDQGTPLITSTAVPTPGRGCPRAC
jgi:hypothetical protein